MNKQAFKRYLKTMDWNENVTVRCVGGNAQAEIRIVAGTRVAVPLCPPDLLGPLAHPPCPARQPTPNPLDAWPCPFPIATL